MAPIHDTDVAQERWSKEEWKNFELWEKIEVKIKNKKRIWIVLTIVVFMVLSSVPVLMDRVPKWKSLKAARVLTQELNQMKRAASVDHMAYTLKITNEETLEFKVYKSTTCNSSEQQFLKESTLLTHQGVLPIKLMNIADATVFELPFANNAFCYSPFEDVQQHVFSFFPVKDLTEPRVDRISVVQISPINAEISFQ